MAKNPNPFVCDECSAAKKPSNGWLLLIKNYVTPSGIGTYVTKWDDVLAEQDGVLHLCGIDCALKVTGRELAKIYQQESSGS